jgi:hypothetical protein
LHELRECHQAENE